MKDEFPEEEIDNFVALFVADPIPLLQRAGYSWHKKHLHLVRPVGRDRFHAVVIVRFKGLNQINIHFDLTIRHGHRFLHSALPLLHLLEEEKKRILKLIS